MQVEPSGWNIVVLGDWNTAILTPDGVRRRLFRAPQDAPLGIEIQIDRPGPYRITYDGIVVIPAASKLEVGAMTPDASRMSRAAEIAARALQELPQTPISAVGINFRYKVQPLPATTLDLLQCPLDEALPDANFEIQWSTATRVIRCGDGVINLEISTTSLDQPNVVINFHRASPEVTAHTAWLEQTAQFFETTNKLLNAIGLRGGTSDA